MNDQDHAHLDPSLSGNLNSLAIDRQSLIIPFYTTVHLMTTIKDGGNDCGDRQNDDGQLASQQALRDILSTFPQDHVEYSFGYGSGVFSQTLHSDKQRHEGILDVIFVVNDTSRFHQANMGVHPHHYASWLGSGAGYGPRLATNVQRHVPWGDGRVLFHVVDDPVPMKYGVVDREDLIRDLTQWESLYLAGRMHKPTLPILGPAGASPLLDEDGGPSLWRAQERNLRAATAAALLLSAGSGSAAGTGGPRTTATTIPWPELFRQIAGLSYTGDFRMQVGGEDPHKLHKLVAAPGQLARFQSMYKPILDSYERTGLLSTSFAATTLNGDHPTAGIDIGGLTWNPNDPSTISFLQQQLPGSIQRQLVVPNQSRARDDTATTDISRLNCDILARALVAIVAPAARHQSFKGIFTLGLRRSIGYASAKLSKGMFRTKK